MSSCPVNSSALLTPYKTLNNNNNVKEIVSFVGCIDINPTMFSGSNQSIKRTLSADMSSPKWLKNNGLTSLKRAQSTDLLYDSEEEEEEEEDESVDHTNVDEKKGAFEDIWNSILSEKNGSGSGQLPPPYVHPSVKRSASSLSEKSLEICTESLGSETGSDGFSVPISSEPEDSDTEAELSEDQPEEQVTVIKINDGHEMNEQIVHVGLAKHCPSPGPNPSLGLRSRSSFPPPLPSLVYRNGSNLRMRSHRQDGRLVLEAVSVPSHNCFRAQRQDGRLLLTLPKDVSCVEHFEHEEDVLEVEDYEDEMEKEEEKLEDEESSFPMGVINVYQPLPKSTALIMSKLVRLTSTRNNSPWRRNINATVIKDLDDLAEEDSLETKATTPKSLLPVRPKMACVMSTNGPISTATDSILNAYEYYWKRTTTVAVLKPLTGQQAPQVVKESNYSKLLLENNNDKSNSKGQVQQEVVIVKAVETGDQREKGTEYLVPLLRGCKEPRRSLLFLDPYCIATS